MMNCQVVVVDKFIILTKELSREHKFDKIS